MTTLTKKDLKTVEGYCKIHLRTLQQRAKYVKSPDLVKAYEDKIAECIRILSTLKGKEVK